MLTTKDTEHTEKKTFDCKISQTMAQRRWKRADYRNTKRVRPLGTTGRTERSTLLTATICNCQRLSNAECAMGKDMAKMQG